MIPDKRPSVLLVDDRRENLIALEAVLGDLDCKLVSATSGQQALKLLLGADEFAVILLDVQMPGLDGFETATYIKQRKKTRSIPIIFVTAISKEPANVFKGYESGAVDYLFKPFDPTVLRSKVAVFLDLFENRRALRESEETLRATFDCAPIGMARLNGAGRLLDANQRLAETLGLPRVELLERTLDGLTHEDDVDLDAAQRAALLRGEVPRYEVQKRLLGSHGTVIPVLLSLSLAGEPGREDPVVLAQVQDLRERQRAERAREDLIREQAARAEAEAAARRIEAVQLVTDATLSHLALDELVPELLNRIAEVLVVDTVAIVLAEGRGNHVMVHASGSLSATVAMVARAAGTGGGPSDSGLAARVAERVEPVIINDVGADPDLDGHALGDAVVSVIGVPLLAEGRVIGALEAGTILPREFTAEDAELLGLAADRAALVLERARMYEQEHDIAVELQRSLLPDRLPTVPGLHLAARYLPGGAGAEVGGDWYDTIPLPGGRLAVVMGDVAGRGVSAASTMGQLRSALRAHALEGGEPGEILQRLNRFLLTLAPEPMATVLLLVVEPATNTVRYASAGHCSPLMLRGDGSAAFLDDVRGVPLGALDSPVYQDATITIDPSEALILYTDGLVEQRGESYATGLDRLGRAANGGRKPRSGTKAPDAEKLCDRILDGVLKGHIREDDVTLLVLRMAPRLEDRLELEVVGNPDALTSMRALLRRWLQETTQDAAMVEEVTMAVNEAAQNAIEHAHDLAATPVQMALAREGGGVTVSIRDRGVWVVHERDDEERGRGLPLMRALMDSVDVLPRATGSTVVLKRDTPENKDPAAD
jgi:PAS domain S-box-containing protein